MDFVLAGKIGIKLVQLFLVMYMTLND